MIGVPGLGMIERRDPHQSPCFDSNIELAPRIEAALHFERPAPAGPARGPDDIGAALAHTRVVAVLFEVGQISFPQAMAAMTESQGALERQGSRVPESLRARVTFDMGWINRNWGDVERAYALQKEAVATLLPGTESLFMQRVLQTSLGIDAMQAGHHEEADVLLRRGLELRKVDVGTNEDGLEAGFFLVADNLLMQSRLDETEEVLNAAPPRGRHTRLLKALVKLERGDARGALELLNSLEPSSGQFDDDFETDRLTTAGLALCATSENLKGLAILESYSNKRSETVFKHDPDLARVRAWAGLCALAAGQRKRAIELAALAHSAFVAQPNVSPYYKAPLRQLEKRLQGG